MAAAQVVTALQSIESRQVDVAEPSVLTVATIHGGNRSDVIPDEVELTGTLRTLSEERRSSMKRRLEEVADLVTRGMGASATMEWMPNGLAGPDTGSGDAPPAVEDRCGRLKADPRSLGVAPGLGRLASEDMRLLRVILHRMLRDGREFRWSTKEAQAA